MFKVIKFEVILKNPYIIKKNRILILYYVDDIVFVYKKYKKDKIKTYIKEFKL